MTDYTKQTTRFGFQKIGGSQELEPDDFNSFLDTVDARLGGPAGNSFFVNETTGDDTYPGTKAKPFATLTAALAAATANNGDVVFLMGSVYVTATVAWNKDGVSLVGITAPSGNCRARISATGATPFSPLVNVTGVGCSFVNFATFHGGFTGATGSQVCWAEAGGRNYYGGVQFLGGGDATTAALAGCRSLTVASQENVFDSCVVGLDTIQRTTAVNAELELIAGNTRNKFLDCTFQAWSSLTTNLHVLVTTLDRYALFRRCAFLNGINSGGGALLAVGFTVGAVGGSVLMDRCASIGATKYATSGPIYQIDATTGLATAIT